jgi:hypothetical protein
MKTAAQHLKDDLTTVIDSVEFIDNTSLGRDRAHTVAEEVLDAYVLWDKRDMPEIKVLGTTVYAGTQMAPDNAKSEDVMERALALLSIGAYLSVKEDEAETMKKKEQQELVGIINEFLPVGSKRLYYASLTEAEASAAMEIRRLRALAK